MRSFNATYYVKVEEGIDGKRVIWVYAHYPNTEPDNPYMIFDFEENAKLFCYALNAENSGVPYSLWLENTVPKRNRRGFIGWLKNE